MAFSGTGEGRRLEGNAGRVLTDVTETIPKKIIRYSGYGQTLGEQQRKKERGQRRQLERQGQAQDSALASARSQRRDADVAKRKANQREPDIASLLSAAAAFGSGGISSTLLSGLGGGLGGSATTLGGRR